MEVAKRNNNNEAITNLAMPERRIPVLIDSSRQRADGFMPSMAFAERGTGDPVFPVRRFHVSLDVLNDSQGRSRFEKEFGPLDLGEWNGLLRLLDLLGRWEAGDRRLEVDADSEEIARELEQACPGEFAIHVRKLPPGVRRQSRSFGMNASLAITAKFTAGLSEARFVIWEDKLTGKFVPGLYCPNVQTALYASVLYGLGVPGGLAICRNPKCRQPFIRSRGETQSYCSHKCQVAAGMRRYRATLELKAKAKSKAITKGKKQAGRK